MLALIPDPMRGKIVRGALLLCVASALTSCVTKDPPPLVADPAASRDSALPWNEQQKWEREGEAAALMQQRR